MPVANGEGHAETDGSSHCYHEVITSQESDLSEISQETLRLDSQLLHSENIATVITRARSNLYTRLNEDACEPNAGSSSLKSNVEDCTGTADNFVSTVYGPPTITCISANSKIPPWRRLHVYNQQSKRIMSYSYRDQRTSYNPVTRSEFLPNHLYANMKLGYACPPVQGPNDETKQSENSTKLRAKTAVKTPFNSPLMDNGNERIPGITERGDIVDNEPLDCQGDHLGKTNLQWQKGKFTNSLEVTALASNDQSIADNGEDCIKMIVEDMVRLICNSTVANTIDSKCNHFDNLSTSDKCCFTSCDTTDSDSPSRNNHSQPDCCLSESLDGEDGMDDVSSEINRDNDRENEIFPANDIARGNSGHLDSCSADRCYDHPLCEDCKINRLTALINLDDSSNVDITKSPSHNAALHLNEDGRLKATVPSISIEAIDESNVFQSMDFQCSGDEFQTDGHQRHPSKSGISTNDSQHLDSSRSFETEQPDITETIQTELVVGEMITVEGGLQDSINSSSDSQQQREELGVRQDNHPEWSVSLVSTEESECSDSDRSSYFDKQGEVADNFLKDETLHDKDLCRPSKSTDNNQDTSSEMEHYNPSSNAKKHDMVAKTVTDVLSIFLKENEPNTLPQCNESEHPDSKFSKNDQTKTQNITSKTHFSTTQSFEAQLTQVHTTSKAGTVQILPAKMLLSKPHMQKVIDKRQRSNSSKIDKIVKPVVSRDHVPTIRLSRPVVSEADKKLQVHCCDATDIVKGSGNSTLGKVQLDEIFGNNSQPGKRTVLFIKPIGSITPLKGTVVASVAVTSVTPSFCTSSPLKAKQPAVSEHNSLAPNTVHSVFLKPSVTIPVMSNACSNSTAKGLSDVHVTSYLPGTSPECKTNLTAVSSSHCSIPCGIPVVQPPQTTSCLRGQTDLSTVTPSLNQDSPTSGKIVNVTEPVSNSTTCNVPTISLTPSLAVTSPDIHQPSSTSAAVGIADHEVGNRPDKEVSGSEMVSPSNLFDKFVIGEEKSFAKDMIELDDLDCSKCTKCVSCNHGTTANIYDVIKYMPDKLSPSPIPENGSNQMDIETQEYLPTISSPQKLQVLGRNDRRDKNIDSVNHSDNTCKVIETEQADKLSQLQMPERESDQINLKVHEESSEQMSQQEIALNSHIDDPCRSIELRQSDKVPPSPKSGKEGDRTNAEMHESSEVTSPQKSLALTQKESMGQENDCAGSIIASKDIAETIESEQLDNLLQLPTSEIEANKIYGKVSGMSSPPEQKCNDDLCQDACVSENTVSDSPSKTNDKGHSDEGCNDFDKNLIVTCYFDDSLVSNDSSLESLDTSLCLEDGINMVRSPSPAKVSNIHTENNDINPSTRQKNDVTDENIVELRRKLISETIRTQPNDVQQVEDGNGYHIPIVEIHEETHVETSQFSDGPILKPAVEENPALPNSSINVNYAEPYHRFNSKGADWKKLQLTEISIRVSSDDILRAELHLPVESRKSRGKNNANDHKTDDAVPFDVRHDLEHSSCRDYNEESCDNMDKEADETNLDLKQNISETHTSDLHVDPAVEANNPIEQIENINITERAKMETENTNNIITRPGQPDFEREYATHDDTATKEFNDGAEEIVTVPNVGSDNIPDLDNISDLDNDKEFTGDKTTITGNPHVPVEETRPCEIIDMSSIPQGLKITEIPENSDENLASFNNFDGYYSPVETTVTNHSYGSFNGNKLSKSTVEYRTMQAQDLPQEANTGVSRLSKTVDFTSVEELALPYNSNGYDSKTNYVGIHANVPVICEVEDPQDHGRLTDDKFSQINSNEFSAHIMNLDSIPTVLNSSGEQESNGITEDNVDDISARNSLTGHCNKQNTSLFCHSLGCNCKYCKNPSTQSTPYVDSAKHIISLKRIPNKNNDSAKQDSTRKDSSLSMTHLDILESTPRNETTVTPELSQPANDDTIEKPAHSVQNSGKDNLLNNKLDNMRPTLQLEDIRANKSIWSSKKGLSCNVKGCDVGLDDRSQVFNESDLNVVFRSLPIAMVKEAHAFVKPIVEALCGHETCLFVKRPKALKITKLSGPRKRRLSAHNKSEYGTEFEGLNSNEKGAKYKRKRTMSLCSTVEDNGKAVARKRGRQKKKVEIRAQCIPKDVMENICPNTATKLVLSEATCSHSSESAKDSCAYGCSSVIDRRALCSNACTPVQYQSTFLTKPHTKHDSTTLNAAATVLKSTTCVSKTYGPQTNVSQANLSRINDILTETPQRLEPTLRAPSPQFLDQDVKLQKRTCVSITPMEHDGILPAISTDSRCDLKYIRNTSSDVSQTGIQLDSTESHEGSFSLQANLNVGLESHAIPEIHEVATVTSSSPILCSTSKSLIYSNPTMVEQCEDDFSRLFKRSQNSCEPSLSVSTSHLLSSAPMHSSSDEWSLFFKPSTAKGKLDLVENNATSSQSMDNLAVAQLHQCISKMKAANKLMSKSLVESEKVRKASLHGHGNFGCLKQIQSSPTNPYALQSWPYGEKSLWPATVYSHAEQTRTNLSPNLKLSTALNSHSASWKQSLIRQCSERIHSKESVTGNLFSPGVSLSTSAPFTNADLRRRLFAKLSRMNAPSTQTEAICALPMSSQQSIVDITHRHKTTTKRKATVAKYITSKKELKAITDGLKPGRKKSNLPKLKDVIVDFVPTPSRSQHMLHGISCKDTEDEDQNQKNSECRRESSKHVQSELPYSILSDREQRDLHKSNGNSFVQDAPCFDIARMYGVETSGPQFGDQSWRKCRECRSIRRRDSASVFCRFYGFRKLQFKDNLLCTAGFLQPNECSAKDLQLWLPQENCFNQPCQDNKNVLSPAGPFETEVANFILANIGKRFCEIASIEVKAKSWITDVEKIYWKKPVPGVRDLCDVCETTLFNIHWICPKCGYGVCLDCFDRRRRKPAKEQKTYDSKPTNSFRWGRCVKGQNHIHSGMVPTQIIPSTCLEDLNKLVHNICKVRNIQTSCHCQMVSNSGEVEKSKVSSNMIGYPIEQQLSQDAVEKHPLSARLSKSVHPSIELVDFLDDPDAPKSKDEDKVMKSPGNEKSDQESSEAQLQWLCDGRLLQLTDSQHPGNLAIFKEHWKYGTPVVVSGVGKYLNMNLWHPSRLSSEYGEEESKNSLINCLTGSIVTNMRIRDFWDGFEDISSRLCDEENKTMILKLKDWPPTEAFHDVMPEMFEDLMRALPLPEYTFVGGRCNLASRLPQFFVKPDLGPKMYNAYGWVTETNWKQGTTNLHLDISDAVNVMVYVGIPHDEPEEAKERLIQIVEDGDVDEIQRLRAINEKPGALWHIFHEKDVNKIRKFIKKVWMERGEVDAADHDPIHDQQMYLDRGLRRRLKEEYGVEGCGIVQCEGDGVFIPAGAPHQVFNLHSCIKIAEDFVSPEHVDKCFYLTNEFRYLSSTHSNHEDKLQIKNIIYHTVKDIASSAIHSHCLNKR